MRDAVVSRVLPAGLRVSVTERVPRVIVRNRDGRLVWVDDDAVHARALRRPRRRRLLLPRLDEATSKTARRENRERVAVVSNSRRDWERAGMSTRVSEVDLADLRDVRVHLAGADAGIQVSLITKSDDSGGAATTDEARAPQDYSKRFREALKLLDRRRAPAARMRPLHRHGPGRSPVFGYHPCGSGRVGAAALTGRSRSPPRPSNARAARKSAAAGATKEVKEGEKKKNDGRRARKAAESDRQRARRRGRAARMSQRRGFMAAASDESQT